MTGKNEQSRNALPLAAGHGPVDRPVGRPAEKRCVGGRIVGGCSLHDTEKPELCQKHLHRCPEPRTVDCCGVVDEHDIVECSRCGKQWTVPCNDQAKGPATAARSADGDGPA